MNLDEIQQIFFQECEEGLGTLETAFADLKRGRQDDETINTVFRSVHSIKGGFSISRTITKPCST